MAICCIAVINELLSPAQTMAAKRILFSCSTVDFGCSHYPGPKSSNCSEMDRYTAAPRGPLKGMKRLTRAEFAAKCGIPVW